MEDDDFEAHAKGFRDALNANLPEGAMLEGFVVAASYIDPETGESCDYEMWDHERPYFFTVGLLEAAKFKVIRSLQLKGELE